MTKENGRTTDSCDYGPNSLPTPLKASLLAYIMNQLSLFIFIFFIINNLFIFDIFDFYDISAHWSQFFYSLFQAIVCILGICGNIVAGFILSRREMRNAFNLLLVTLACFDSTYVSIILVQCCYHLESINLWVSSFFL